MNDTMDVSVIIVSWNSQNWITRCLTTLYAQTTDIRMEVIVVDNASKDKTVQFVMNQFPRAQVVQNAGNLGFAAAVNQGLAVASGRYVCFLNPDTEIQDRALEWLVAAMDADPSIGIAAPQLLNQDGTIQASVRRFPSGKDQALILLKLHTLFPDARSLSRYFARDMDYTRQQDVEQVMGACMVIRRELLNQIGPLDSKFFIWFEEVDFCYRAHTQTEFRTVFMPQAHVLHFGGDSFDKVPTGKKQRWYRRSVRYYMRKHRFWGAAALLWLLTPASLLAGWAVSLAARTQKGGSAIQRAKERRKRT